LIGFVIAINLFFDVPTNKTEAFIISQSFVEKSLIGLSVADFCPILDMESEVLYQGNNIWNVQSCVVVQSRHFEGTVTLPYTTVIKYVGENEWKLEEIEK
jgi:hypothetical protein